MSAHREVRLFCDHHDPPAEGGRFGRRCLTEFQASPDLGFVSQISVMRKEAAKAGWTLVRSHLGRAFDKDYCPDHNPEETANA